MSFDPSFVFIWFLVLFYETNTLYVDYRIAFLTFSCHVNTLSSEAFRVCFRYSSFVFWRVPVRTQNTRVQRAANDFKFDYDYKDFILDIVTR